MDLADALGDAPASSNPLNNWPAQGNVQPGAPAWPGQPSQPAWPGQPNQPLWPGQPTQPMWPGNPGQPVWPGQNPSAPAPAPTPTGPLTVPYTLNLPRGLHDKLLITIAGLIMPNPKMITLDFSAGKDIVFHLNPRFNEEGKQTIVRNSMIGGRWGKEERQLGQFPFAAGQPFELKVLCTNTELKVAVNNNHLLEFKHRTSELQKVTSVIIYNDVTLKSVNMEVLP